MSYRGGQRGSRAARPAAFKPNIPNIFSDPRFFAGRGATAAPMPVSRPSSVRPLMSDELPPGAFMKETGEVLGMSSEQVPEGGYMTETGRVYVPAGYSRPETQGPTRNVYEQPGVGFFDRQSGRFLGKAPAAPGMGVTPIVRQEDDQYRQLLSQYGALQKEKKFEEADKLGMQIWEQKYGKTPMGQPGGAIGTENPLMRSMREMFPGRYGETPALESTQPVPEFGARAQAGGGHAGTFREQPGLFQGVANPITPTEAFNQGAAMDANRGVENLQVWQKSKTTGEGMPAFQTTGEKAAEFLSDPNIMSLFKK